MTNHRKTAGMRKSVTGKPRHGADPPKKLSKSDRVCLALTAMSEAIAKLSSAKSADLQFVEAQVKALRSDLQGVESRLLAAVMDLVNTNGLMIARLVEGGNKATQEARTQVLHAIAAGHLRLGALDEGLAQLVLQLLEHGVITDKQRLDWMQRQEKPIVIKQPAMRLRELIDLAMASARKAGAA
jgi:hypothetical protein